MDHESKQMRLDELRTGKNNFISDDIVLDKNMFGGFKKKAVLDYINSLKESLQNAERSFRSRIEEYSEASVMLTQDRDKYKNILNDIEDSNLKLQQKINALTKENENLNLKIKELTENALDESEIEKYKEVLIQNDEMKKTIENQEIKINEYEDDNLSLTKNIDSLEQTINELTEQIENMAKNVKSKEEYDFLYSENELIKQQFDEALSEKSMLLAEKNILAEQNKRLNDNLEESNEKIKALREENSKMRLNTRKMIAKFEEKIYECSQNHKQNIEQISNNVKNVLNILTYEKTDISKLLSIADEDLELENDMDLDAQQK